MSYKSKATPEQREQNMQIVYDQLKLIKVQETDEIPLEHSKIRCVCMKLVSFKNMYKCLYCGIWFCKECAELHFGDEL